MLLFLAYIGRASSSLWHSRPNDILSFLMVFSTLEHGWPVWADKVSNIWEQNCSNSSCCCCSSCLFCFIASLSDSIFSNSSKLMCLGTRSTFKRVSTSFNFTACFSFTSWIFSWSSFLHLLIIISVAALGSSLTTVTLTFSPEALMFSFSNCSAFFAWLPLWKANVNWQVLPSTTLVSFKKNLNSFPRHSFRYFVMIPWLTFSVFGRTITKVHPFSVEGEEIPLFRLFCSSLCDFFLLWHSTLVGFTASPTVSTSKGLFSIDSACDSELPFSSNSKSCNACACAIPLLP